jgi:hypothetical protein
VATAEPANQIAVGHPYLDWLRLAPARAADVEAVLEGKTEFDRYRRAHTYVKHYERSVRA